MKSATPPLQEPNCNNCGNPMSGKYCSNCGQKAFHIQDKSLKAIAKEVLHFVTHFEGTAFTSLITLYKRPGQYALDYCNGVRKRYFKPVSLFLLLVIIYLLFPILKGLNVELSTFIKEGNRTTYFEAKINEAMIERNLSFNELAVQYGKRSEKISKILLLVLIPLSAIFLKALFFRAKKYAYDLFILATELNIYFLLTFYLILPAVIYPFILLWPGLQSIMNETTLVILVLVSFSLFCYFAFKRFFAQNFALSILKAILFPVLHLFVVITAYRYLLFFLSII